MAKIDIAKQISKALSDYTTEVEQGLEEAKTKVAKNAVKGLRNTSPEQTGDYAKGWARKKVGTAEVIHNRTDYQLTHLLENGHAKRGGGRVKAIPHIKPVEEKAIEEFIDEVEKVIEG